MNIFDDKNKCYGCSACKGICPVDAIFMQMDEQGFQYPKVNDKLCIKCNKCKIVCPIEKIEFNAVEKVYALKHTIQDDQRSSQSGGAFFAIAEKIIEKKGVVYGCILDDKFKPVHIRTDSFEGIRLMKGSKYVQSNMENIYHELIEDVKSGKWVLFSGTSCQIEAVKRTLAKLNCSKVILVDLICHGVPSPKLWQDHVNYLKKKLKGILIKISFRDKQFYTWGGHMEVVAYQRNKKIRYYHNKLFTSLFYSNYALRPSCYNCEFKNGNYAGDITIADFWGIDKINPEFYDENGVSLVLVHNKKGDEFLREINRVIITEINGNAWKDYQMKSAAKRPRNYDEFWQDYYNNGYIFITKKYLGNNIKGNIKFFIKRILNRFGLMKI